MQNAPATGRKPLRLLLAAIAAALVTIAGCGGGGDSPEPVAYTDVTTTLFRPFAAGEYVFRTRAELDAALAAAPFRTWPVGIVATEPAIPAWDFQTSMVVGFSRGEGYFCAAPHLTEVLVQGQDMQVRYRASATGTLACQFLGPLIAFAQVPTVSGTVTFVQVP